METSLPQHGHTVWTQFSWPKNGMRFPTPALTRVGMKLDGFCPIVGTFTRICLMTLT